jgi:hypothetical protein
VAAGRARGSRPRRVSLPGVAELLRPVGPGLANDFGRQASGREAHPQKITVYLSSDEFLDLERARLTLRAHGIGVDRGRLVREAIALLMTDLEAGIDASVIANRLRAAGTPDPADDGPVAFGAPVNGALADDAWVNRDLTDAVRVDGGPTDVAGVTGGVLADVVRVAGGPTDVAGVKNGVLAGAGPANGIPVDGGSVHGGLADGGSVNGGLAGGGPVVGVLANGIGVTGPPEGPQ